VAAGKRASFMPASSALLFQGRQATPGVCDAAGCSVQPVCCGAAAVFNEAGVLGIRVTSTAASTPQPCVGIVDCGASFSAINIAAAKLFGLIGPRGEILGSRGPDMTGIGVDGRPQPLPTTSVAFTFAGDCSVCARTTVIEPGAFLGNVTLPSAFYFTCGTHYADDSAQGFVKRLVSM